MVCIHCQLKTQVINSRHQVRLNQVWRRRRCNNGHIFTTQEIADYTAVWLVRASQSSLQPFVRDKLFVSLLGSLGHRSTALSDAGALTTTIVQKLAPQIRDGVIDAMAIRTIVQVVLNRFDTVASTHYRAFHASN